MSADSGTAVPSVSDASRSSATAQRKPRIALFIATACGLHIPVALGNWFVAGVLLAASLLGLFLVFVSRDLWWGHVVSW
jgi:hypothetical protein